MGRPMIPVQATARTVLLERSLLQLHAKAADYLDQILDSAPAFKVRPIRRPAAMAPVSAASREALDMVKASTDQCERLVGRWQELLGEVQHLKESGDAHVDQLASELNEAHRRYCDRDQERVVTQHVVMVTPATIASPPPQFPLGINVGCQTIDAQIDIANENRQLRSELERMATTASEMSALSDMAVARMRAEVTRLRRNNASLRDQLERADSEIVALNRGLRAAKSFVDENDALSANSLQRLKEMTLQLERVNTTNDHLRQVCARQQLPPNRAPFFSWFASPAPDKADKGTIDYPFDAVSG